MSKCIRKLCFRDFILQRARSRTNSPAGGITRNCCAALRCHPCVDMDVSLGSSELTRAAEALPARECAGRFLRGNATRGWNEDGRLSISANPAWMLCFTCEAALDYCNIKLIWYAFEKETLNSHCPAEHTNTGDF